VGCIHQYHRLHQGNCHTTKHQDIISHTLGHHCKTYKNDDDDDDIDDDDNNDNDNDNNNDYTVVCYDIHFFI
jgi:hypothetical protein